MPKMIRWKNLRLLVFTIAVLTLVGIRLQTLRSEQSQTGPLAKREHRTTSHHNKVKIDLYNSQELLFSPKHPKSHLRETGDDLAQYADQSDDVTKTPRDIVTSSSIGEQNFAAKVGRLSLLKSTTTTSSPFRVRHDDEKGKLLPLNSHLQMTVHPPISTTTEVMSQNILNISDTDVIRDGINFSFNSSKRNASESFGAGTNNEDIRRIKIRFEERSKRIQEACQMEILRNEGMLNTKGQIRVVPLAFKRLSICLVPKVGSTYIKFHLKKKLKLKNQAENLALFDSNPEDRKQFVIVREPYGRLVSAYFSKVVSHPKWWISLGRFIVFKFRRSRTEKGSRCGHDVTFPEFVKYFIAAQRSNRFKNVHFVPMYEVCNPCFESDHKIRFDYVAHLESMTEDMSYILNSVNITTDDDFRFKPVRTIVSHFMNRDYRHAAYGAPWCPTFQRLWWALQSNGHIANSVPFPLKDMECDSITTEEMMNITLKAVDQSQGTFDKTSQKREAVAKLYAQVSFRDRVLVRDALMTDFKLFGYDPMPDFVFSPEEIERIKMMESR